MTTPMSTVMTTGMTSIIGHVTTPVTLTPCRRYASVVVTLPDATRYEALNAMLLGNYLSACAWRRLTNDTSQEHHR